MLGSQHGQADSYRKEIKPAAEKERSFGNNSGCQKLRLNLQKRVGREISWDEDGLGRRLKKTWRKQIQALLTAIHGVSTAGIMDNDF